MIRRRGFITLLGGAAAGAWPLPAWAQQGDRMRQMGVLMPAAESNAEARARLAAFREELTKFGWVEGRNLAVTYRWAPSEAERVQAGAELARMALDAIFAGNNLGVAALYKVTRTIPIVFAQVGDPVGAGFVASLARPGGNVTGFAASEDSFAVKWLELLKEIAPRVDRVAVMFDPEIPTSYSYVREIETAAPSLAVLILRSPVRDGADIAQAIDAFAQKPGGGLIVQASPVALAHRDEIAALAGRHGLPSVSPYRYYVASGGLASYGIDEIDLFRRAAGYVDRILRGAKPADLPVQLPVKFQMVLNAKTAKALGLTVPSRLISIADEIIE